MVRRQQPNRRRPGCRHARCDYAHRRLCWRQWIIRFCATPWSGLRSPALEEAERWIASRPHSAPVPTEETQVFIGKSRHAATRRRNILTGSLAAGLVLALGLAGFAYWQRGIAVEQRSIAERNEALAKVERDNATRNFSLAQKTADSLVFDIAQGLRNAKGMRAETVRQILETARTTFEQLAASAPNDLTLQRSRAEMLNEFGHTYITLGDLPNVRYAPWVQPIDATSSNLA
jgi:hypothetical protein